MKRRTSSVTLCNMKEFAGGQDVRMRPVRGPYGGIYGPDDAHASAPTGFFTLNLEAAKISRF